MSPRSRRVELLHFFIYGKPVTRWYDFEIHRFVRAPAEKWVKVTVYYEGGAHGSYHVDCGIVIHSLDFEVSEKMDQAMERVKEKVMRALKWHDWSEIEMNLGLRIGVAVEDDGEPEEWCEVWRV